MKRAVVAIVISVAAAGARADDVDRRYAEEPTNGVALPLAGLAGEQDAQAVSANPGGMALLRGGEAAFVLELEDPDVATSAGQGFGAFVAAPFGGGILPRAAIGLGLEWLRPSRSELTPDPGKPFRSTLAFATALGPRAGFGVSWHHFHAEGALAGVDTFDLGLSARLNNYAAFGAALRDVATSPIANTPVQRRYEAELLFRPLGRDALEIALGGRLGETRLDTDGWARASLRIERGVTVHALVESRELHALEDSPLGVVDAGGRDLRTTIGIEVSFGGFSIASTATGIRSTSRSSEILGGGGVLRIGSEPASVIAPREHLERVELSGDIGARELTAIVMRLRAIARDPTAIGLVVTFDGLGSGYGALQELRDEIAAVRRAHKKTFAYMVSGSTRDYFVATAAEKIYMDPAGMLRFTGIASESQYLRGVFDKVGVFPQYERVGEFKSAPEQFTETGPTDIATKMREALYDSIWTQIVDAIASARKLTPAQVQQLVDAGPYSAGDLAKDSKLVDAVAPPDTISELVVRELGRAVPVGERPSSRPERWTRPHIAVIYIDGDISDGASRNVPFLGQRLAGGQTLVAAIEAARADPRISAIVLRIDSPGGSALASELIAREVFATRGVKPIVCSMSNLAASGGYFVAAGCDVIFAEPMTITGSIGIFFGKFDLSGLLAKLGVHDEIAKRGAHADAESRYRPYTDAERATLLEKLTYMYSRFVGAVAEGRGMTKEAVDAVGRGHVWTGEQAKPNKLVDRFGGIGDAIDEAKKRAQLGATRVELVELPVVPAGLLGTIGGLLGGGASADAAPVSITDLPAVRAVLRAIPASVLVSPETTAQARLPFSIDIE